MSSPLRNEPAPAPSETAPMIPIVRCNANERFNVRFVCLSEKIWGMNIHFAGKSKVCLAPTWPCEWCEQGKPFVWKGYLAAADQLGHKRFIVELTAGVVPDINRYLELWSSLRGRLITLTRPSAKPTGRLAIDIGSESTVTPEKHCPPCFRLVPVLEKIYGVDKPESMQDGSRFNINTVSAAERPPEEMSSLACRMSTVQADDETRGGVFTSNGKPAA